MCVASNCRNRLWTQIRAEVAAIVRTVLASGMEDEQATRNLWRDVLEDLLTARTACNDVRSKTDDHGDDARKNCSNILQKQSDCLPHIDRDQLTTVQNWLNGEQKILNAHIIEI